jgi:hypothetical protein
MIDDKKCLKSQIYNADEIGFFWRSRTENAQAYRHEMSTPGRRISKERIWTLLSASADAPRRLTPSQVAQESWKIVWTNYQSHKKVKLSL